MRLARFAVSLVALAVGSDARAAPVPTQPTLTADERVLRAVFLPISGPAVLDFFRQQTRAQVEPPRLEALLRQLSDPNTATYQQATAELITVGIPALPALRQAANSLDDAAAAERAKRCLQSIEGPSAVPLVAASARLVALRKPPDAAAVLLSYLPFAANDAVVREVEAALAAVAFRDGKLEPALPQALEDPVPVRRGAAAALLCQVGKPEHLPAVRRLLKDAKPTVRLRAALGLAKRHEADAVSVLIDLFLELPAAERGQVEAYLFGLAGEWSVQVPQSEDAVARRLRRDLWAAWWKQTEGPAALDEIRKRMVPDAEREQLQALIRKLGDDDVQARERAGTEILSRGGIPVSLYRRAQHEADPRVREIVNRSPHLLDPKLPHGLPIAALRLATLRRPPGTTEALLAYLPCVENDGMVGQIQESLAALAFDGPPGAHATRLAPALLRALDDKVPVRRTVAAELLIEHGTDADRAAVRKLFRDPDPAVRLRVAQALAERFDKAAVPVLVALLTELSPAQGAAVEDYLRYLACEQSPQVFLDADPASRRKCRDAWEAWWRQYGPEFDLAKHDSLQKVVGKTLLVEQVDAVRQTGRVLLVDAGGQVLWQIDGLQFPTDAELIADDRVLVAEGNSRQVVERDAKGAVHWQKVLGNYWPVGCQRLANGNTFIACNNRLLEVDRKGNEVFAYDRPGQDIVAGRKLRTGQVVFFTQTGSYVRLDAKGREVKSYRVDGPQNYYQGGMVHFLPNDHLLITQSTPRLKVVEFDGDGKPVRETPIPIYPTSVVRLRNGHLLLASVNTQNVVELDNKGKTVWEFKDAGVRPYRAVRAEMLK